MKKHYALYSLLLIPALVLVLAFTGGAPAGNTGSPLDGQDCTSCHPPGPAVQATNWITTNIPTLGYVPGNTYTITLTVIDLVADKYGFEITAETGIAKTGTWVITDAARTQLVGTAFVTHTSAGTSPSGSPNIWTVDWNAPASGTGEVGFYAAVNVTNNDGTYENDDIFTTLIMIPESNVGIAENLLENNMEVYPNPVTNLLNITVPANSEIRIFDNAGRIVMQQTSSMQTESLDVSTLVTGMYFVHVSHDGQTASRSIIKK